MRPTSKRALDRGVVGGVVRSGKYLVHKSANGEGTIICL